MIPDPPGSSGPYGPPPAPRPPDLTPQDTLNRVRGELAEVSGRLAQLAADVQRATEALPQAYGAPPAPTYAPPAHAPVPGYGPAGYGPPAYGPPAYGPPPGPSFGPPAYGPPTYGPPGPPGAPAPQPRPAPQLRPRRQISVAEIFAVVGSAITLIGVTFVLVLPADGVLGQLPRVGIAVVLAVAAVAVAVWQHAKDARNLGAQALMATGVASAYLCVLAVTVLFERPDGRGLLPDAIGLALAGVISIGGLWMARRWNSQWLAVLAVLGSLVLAPFVVQPDLIGGIAFMIVLTVATAPFQRGRTWLVLMAARIVPTSLVFAGAALFEERSVGDHPNLGLALAAFFALAVLAMGVWHQRDTRPQQVASAAATVIAATPALMVCWLADRPWAAVTCAVLGGLYAAVGILPRSFSAALRSAAVPLGALFVGFAVLRITDNSHVGTVVFGLAAVYLVLAARTRFRPVLVVALVLAGLGTLAWLSLLTGVLDPGEAERHGFAGVVQSLVGLVVVVLAERALRVFGVVGSWLAYLVWAGAVAFGSVAVVLAGTSIGGLLGARTVAFQTAQAMVTVIWLVLCVVLLWLGLRATGDGLVSVRLAVGLALAAVLKLFLFDLATLPGLVRALAFLAVGVLLLVIGTWYYRQLDRVRRQPGGPR